MDLHIRIVEARDVPNMDIVGKSDPFVVVTVSGTTRKWKTQTVQNSSSPIWNHKLMIQLVSGQIETIKLTLYDNDELSDPDEIASLKIPVSQLADGNVKDAWYPMECSKGNPTIRLVAQLVARGGTPSFK